MRGLTSSSLEVSACHLVRDIIVRYTHWWQKVAGTTYAAVHISGPPTAPTRKGACPIRRVFGEKPPSRGGKTRAGRKPSKGKETISTLPIVSTGFRIYFVNIGFDMEKPTVEVLHPSKKKVGLEKRMPYKYPRARKIFTDLVATHSMEEIRELLVVGIEFPDLGIVKIEAEHPVPSFKKFGGQTGRASFEQLGHPWVS